MSESGGRSRCWHLISGDDITADFSFGLFAATAPLLQLRQSCYWPEPETASSGELLLCRQ